MSMEWQIKTISRKSSLTGEAFRPGDRAVSLIYAEEGSAELGRADLLDEEVDGYELPGALLGRWVRLIRDPDEESASAQETIASAEDFFFSLYQNTEAAARSETNVLKHLIGLMLERKRILKAVGPRQVSGEQVYRHVKSKQEIAVPIVDISHQLMLQIEETIGDLMA